ncbi:MAG TPA: protein kinase [Polyangiaceae bacterium]|nr:protein kinase [Polyangiaceae bacterium]
MGRMLGVGGMGMVYAARDARLDRQVAIKVLLPRLVTSHTATQRFVREARAATRITSEHVVKLLEIDTLPDGTPLLVMEYLDGRDLRAVLREQGPLAPRQAVDYLLQALQAVAEGHTQNIVHRDLKPSNLFLATRADGTPLIKVLDFGIAKTLEPEPAETFALTSSEDVRLGSPTYMPPEQLQNPRDVDMRSDIWALGVTLHELVCGSPPFQGQTYAELLSRILSSPPDSLKARVPDASLPNGLREVIGKCLEKNREQRYSNAAELATALAPFGSDDARLSMHRVTGLTRSPSSPRPSSGPATIITEFLGTCETTLPVPTDPALGPHHPPESGARRVAQRSPRRRLTWLALAAIAAVTLGSVLWRQQRFSVAQASETRAAASTPTILTTSVSSLRTGSAPSREAASDSAAFIGARTAPPAATTLQEPPKLASTTRTPALKNSPLAASAADPKPSALPSATSPAAEGDATREAAGLSQIERLIEKRH